MLLEFVSTIDSIISLPLPLSTAITRASLYTSMPIYLMSATHAVASLRERPFALTESFPQGKVSFFSPLAYLLFRFLPLIHCSIHSKGPLS